MDPPPGRGLCTLSSPGGAVSGGHRNNAGERLRRCQPAQGLSRARIQLCRHGVEMRRAVDREVGALWKILAQEPVDVFIAPTLPRTMRIAEVHLDPSVDCEAHVLSHLLPAIPRE